VSTTPELIDTLSQSLQPVRPSRPPVQRACLWLAAVIAAVSLAAFAADAWPLMLHRLSLTRFAIEEAATLATGISGVLAAFLLSVPDRRRSWVWLPMPFLLIWLATSGYGCYDNWLVSGADGLRIGRSGDCFVFIVGFSVPLAVALWLALRRSAAMLDPVKVTAAGGFGIAALAAASLQFWHPFDVTVADLMAHSAAVTLVITLLVTTARRQFAPAAG
jgi:ABC-type amino acid transport substrate-binding protein